MHRIQNLSLTFPEDSPRLNLTAAPVLEALHIASSGTHRISLPSDIFSGYLPCLTEVHLTNITLSWSPSPFTSLLMRLRLANVAPPSLDNLLELLRSLSTLVSLDIEGSLPTHTQPLDQINLPTLQALRIADAGTRCLLFLRFVTFPKSAVLTIGHQTGADEFQHCLGALAKHISAQAQPIRSLFLSQRIPEAKIKASPHHLGDITVHEWFDHSFPAELNHPFTFIDDFRALHPQNLREFCSHLSLSTVTSCFMDGGSDQYHHWSSILALLPNLQCLSIGGDLLEALITFLQGSDSAACPSGSPRLPSLAVVSISMLVEEETPELEPLLELLEGREALGVPLEILYIEDEVEIFSLHDDSDGRGAGSPHFVSALSCNFRTTEVIGRDRNKHIWFHQTPGAIGSA